MNILLVKLSAIGDVVMATAALPELRRRYPTLRLTWVCGNTVAPLLAAVPGIDELIVIDEKRLLTGSKAQKIGEMLSLWRRLGRRRFDLVVTGHADPRYRLLTRWVQTAERRAFSHQGRHGPLQGRHHADEYLRLLIGEDGPDAPAARFPDVPASLPQAVEASLPAGPALVVLVPGGARNTLNEDTLRRWPVALYRQLAEKLLAAGHAVILAGNKDDAWVRPDFAGLPVIDVIGRTNLLEAVALFRRADLTITHDTGSLHLTRLSGAPVLALFGPTMPNRTGPMRRHAPEGRAAASRSLWGGEALPCRPCYDGRAFALCPSNRCMESITPDTVYEAAAQILDEVGVIAVKQGF